MQGQSLLTEIVLSANLVEHFLEDDLVRKSSPSIQLRRAFIATQGCRRERPQILPEEVTAAYALVETSELVFFEWTRIIVTDARQRTNISRRSRDRFAAKWTHDDMDSRAIATLFIFIVGLPEFRLSQGSAIRLKKDTIDPSKVSQLSWHPRAFVYRGFLSDEECDHLIELARDKLEKSMVADSESGKTVESEVRTSSGMFLNNAQDEAVAAIEKRIAAWTFLPEENGENMQVLHYENGQKDEPHYDFFHDNINQQLGHRVATVLMYLSNVEKGGETVFPNALEKLSQPKDENWSDCAKTGNALKPLKGDALLFFSLHLNATTDENSLHGSCPVIEGEKWSATKWIHVRSFDPPSLKSLRDCKDENENCDRWAVLGECTKNPLYMVGPEPEPDTAVGFCRKSCGVCS
ncbi:unnamed protein product [Rhodiola kirilowii]